LYDTARVPFDAARAHEFPYDGTMRSVVASLLVVACSFRPHEAAPNDGGDDDGGSNAPGSDGGQASIPCATPNSFRSQFSSATLPQWYQLGSNSSIIGGTTAAPGLTLMLMGGMSNAGVYAKHAVNLTGHSMDVEVPAVVAGSGSTAFYAGVDSEHYLLIAEKSGNLISGILDTSTTNSTSQATYDPVNDRWWRFREGSGMVNFETSPDGTTWNARRSPVATPSWVDYVRADLFATGSGMPGMAQFAAFDTSQPADPWCKAVTLEDAFPTGDEQWANGPLPTQPVTCTDSFSNEVTITATMPGTCYVGTSYAWDLSDSSFTIHWAPATGSATPMFMPMVELANDSTTAGVFVNGGSACYPAAGSNCVPYAFSPSGQDQQWRVSESTATGMLTFESSPDGSNWTTIVASPQPFGSNGPTGLELRLGATATTGSTNQVVFGAVN
jgi:hypothetical protein